ncbi:unnamed protein product [Didymodactylos carnosus]|uniref:ABM domain-containing protein n=1 Tax=Didymodactylos carnosus TaxID=1234261 RepID=A0A813WNV1_9BILA|nr:unnamed protein product [Didymodactylos carnosus]CAF0853886.1 unnamed protein product [Didymodactylos carnosus]CAF3570718.1 unnamed protein product [Didymodactylos carnosus]CAF3641469.1 unnamed protein product [Didymodactylos carnosus]
MSSSSAIYVIIDIFVKAEKSEYGKKILYGLVDQSKKEDGCMRYRLCENLTDKTHFTIIEQWESEENYEEHLQSEHIKKAGEQLKDDFLKPVEEKRYKSVHIDNNMKKTIPKNSSSFCTIL